MTEALTDEELAYLQSRFDVAREGRTAELTADIDAGLPVNLTNGAGDSLLILAAYHRHADLVRALLARDADTERVNDRGQTALGSAVFRQAGEIVSDLLVAGADPAGGGRSALDVARFFGLTEMLALLEADRTAPPTDATTVAPPEADATVVDVSSRWASTDRR